MASVIRPNRTEVSRTFPYLGFTIRTGRPASYEVVLTTDASLLEPSAKARRTSANFASTRALGPLPAPTGEAVWIVPAPMLARFAGHERLHYAAAVFPNGDLQHPEIVKLSNGAAPAVTISRSYTGATRRLAGITAGSSQPNGAGGAQWGGGASLEWAGDAVPAGTIAPIAPAAPVAQAAAFEYSDGLGPMPVEELVEADGGGIEGPIPDDGAVAQSLDAIAPEYPQASRFAPAHSGNYRARTTARTVRRVVIHITDGGSSINGTIGWFQNPTAKVSAHYVIGQDGEIVQMVRHDDVAWHASNANGDSIGIEHVANTRGLMPSEAQLCASALLVNWLCTTYGIPIDRQHVLGHAEADAKTTHRGCPNAVWNWDAYMPMVISGSCHPAVAEAVALGQQFDERWADVEPVPQLTGMSCWAAAAAMVVGWRDMISIAPAEIATASGHWKAYKEGLSVNDSDEFAAIWDLEAAPPQSYTVDGFRALLSNGPMYIARRVPSGHAVCVYGLSGDGSRDGTFVHYHDPWPPGTGAPAQVSVFEQFMAEYENYATQDPTGRVNNQILYPKTTSGRTLTSTTQALAAPARGLQAVEVASAIVGATMSRILDNEGDVHWELDQLNGVKRPWNDDAHKGPVNYRNQTLAITGPRSATVSGWNQIFADCSLDFQYNGRSVGNVAIAVTGNSDAPFAGLTVKAQIIDDANAYTAPGFPEPFAAVKVRFHYRFDYSRYDDRIAISTVTLYGNGTHAFEFKWTQT